MNITYQCDHCRAWSTVGENKVGSNLTCRECGSGTIVPNTPDPFESLKNGPSTSSPTSAPTLKTSHPVVLPTKESNSSLSKLISQGLGLVGFLIILALKFGLFFPNGGNARPPRPRPFQGGPAQIPPPKQLFRPVKIDLGTPIEIPKNFPKLDAPHEIVPGVNHYEIRLKPDDHPPGFIPPGHSSTLWLYLPKNKAQAPPGSLPCVLLAPSGSNSISGMKLTPTARVEHIPYVEAGFAVLAFELDGGDRKLPPSTPSPAFLLARGGLANGQIAIEFLKARVPLVDSNRLYVAGHGTAGTFALLLAEHEPIIKACLVYAPVIDVADRIRKNVLPAFAKQDAYAEVFRLLSPTTAESNLNCPLFLFNARDNERVAPAQTREFADRLLALGKPVTLDIVAQGGDVQAMLDIGISSGIKWLTQIDSNIKKK